MLVNDVTALRSDPDLAGVVADAGAYLCLMHMLGEPRTMQDDPRYATWSRRFLVSGRAARSRRGGRDPEDRICLDPGIGFGKTVEHNLELLARMDSWSRSVGRYSSAPRASASSGAFSAIDAVTGPVAAGVAVPSRLRARCRSSGCTTSGRRRGAGARQVGGRVSEIIIQIEGLELGASGALAEENGGERSSST